jgi:dTDP-4-amino-4,6-dideoxygalactose transaminase
LIPHSKPTLTEADAARVAAVVRSGQIAQGPEVAAFERELAVRLGTPAAAAVSSGSAALELALRALDVAGADEVVIPTYVCAALHHAVTRVGATPVLAEADPATLSVDPADVERRLSARTKCVIVPHAFGLAASLQRFDALGVPVIEDCAQAIGATDDGRPVGSRGRLSIVSFYATKMLTTGEGGAVAGPRDLIERVRDLRDYDERLDLAPRFNYKMSDLQAALGRSQLARLDEFIARRHAVAARYRARLSGAPYGLPPDPAGGRHVYHRFVVDVGRPVGAVIDALAAGGVMARRPVFRPLHQALGSSGFDIADRLWSERLSLPCYPALAAAEIDTVAGALTEALRR